MEMMNKREFFPPRPEANPTIYAYELPDVGTHQGLLKVGYTSRTSQNRIAEQAKKSMTRTMLWKPTPTILFTQTNLKKYSI